MKNGHIVFTFKTYKGVNNFGLTIVDREEFRHIIVSFGAFDK
jgi:hypothetical protein